MQQPPAYTWKDVCAERNRRQKALRLQKKVVCRSAHNVALVPYGLP